MEIPDKAYFRIGEVSRLLEVEPYVVRYWETEFKTVKPIRTRSDQRLYRRKDVEELVLIRKLLYEQKFTIAGARRRLHEMRKEDPEPAGGEDCREKLRSIQTGLKAIRDLLR